MNRHCTLLGHNNNIVQMVCTFVQCTNPTRWMCVKCKDLHADHIKICVTMQEFIQNNQEKQSILKSNSLQQQLREIQKQFSVYSESIQYSLQSIGCTLQAWLKIVQQNECTQSNFNTQMGDSQSTLLMTELQLTKLIAFLNENQDDVFTHLKKLNANVEQMADQLANLAILKHGTITEELSEYQNSFKQVGEYRFGMKVGQWTIMNNNGEIKGGGIYNEVGNKDKQWTEIEFNSKSDYIIYSGIYKEGNRINQWDIKDPKGAIIGGGQYNQFGKQEGDWIDVEIQLKPGYKYIQHIGKYLDGKRIGQWDTRVFNGEKIGGGQYNLYGNKDGQWINVVLNQMLGEKYILQTIKYTNGIAIDQPGDKLITDQQCNYINGLNRSYTK